MKPEKNEIIYLENTCKRYQLGEELVQALCHVDLKIQRGDFLAIIGPSGSGKSTMMNLVGALDLPTEGNIYLDNQNIANLSESDLAQIRGKKIGFIFQTFNLVPTLTALENVMLPMMFQGTSAEEREHKAAVLLKKVNLSHRLDHKPGEMSGGERQRVAIARALANDPEVILADEPTGNLDSKTGDEILKMLVDLNKEGKTIIMVTHDLERAKNANHIIKLKDGQVEGREMRVKHDSKIESLKKPQSYRKLRGDQPQTEF